MKNWNGIAHWLLLIVLVGLCLTCLPVAASAASGNPQTDFPVGTEFKTLDVATPKGKLMGSDAMKKLLDPFIRWGYEKLGAPYQQGGRWYQDLVRYSTKRGPKIVTGGMGAGIYWPYRWVQTGPTYWEGCWVDPTTNQTFMPKPRTGTDWCAAYR